MTSIIAKILLWIVGTVAVAVAGLFATSFLIGGRLPPGRDFFVRTQALQLAMARDAYTGGGPAKLAEVLARLDRLYEARHHLVDPAGRDLQDGTDRSLLLSRASSPPRPPVEVDEQLVTSSRADGGPRLLVLIPRRLGTPNLIPYFAWILVVIAGLGYALTLHLARPLRSLRRAVERLGRGDLSARVNSRRRDEIGDLARAFDEMAGRIETLVTAERRLLQDVSHELRSPLARMTFAVELARGEDDRGHALDRLKKDVGRLTELIGQLLELTRAEGDPSSRDRQDIPLDELLREVVEDCSLEAAARGCELRLDAASPILFRGNGELLRRAVENVVRNAIRHAPECSPIDVTVRSALDAVGITVRDRGPGVPEDSLASIFEAFYRVDPDRNRSQGGVGLGLAIARRAIQLHHGSITATNAHPGLRVSIRLPHQ